MVFSSLEFLFLFLPMLLAAVFLTPRRLRNGVLLLGSLLFYIWGGGAFVFILLISVAVDYLAGRTIARGWQQDRPRLRRLGVVLSVTVNLSLLGFFKYSNFAVEQVNELATAFGLGTIAWTTIGLPIGISFFTFQSMSYTIDLARGRAQHLRNPVDFALYVALFPQLICGPIVRFHELSEQIRKRRTGLESFARGGLRFVHGLVKKVVLADAAGTVADSAFGLPADQLTTADAWLGVVAYSLQIYFDFSGYSDMAIGLGTIFGFTFPENFRRPYSASSITDFWRRWHITLSSWLRDYLYIPLGGSRAGGILTYRNLILVFLLTGLWHGAAWQFLAWGAYHGTLLVVERLSGQRAFETASYPWLRRPCTLLLVIIGWVIFRADSMAHAGWFYASMFSLGDLGLSLSPVVAVSLTNRVAVTLAVASTVVLLPSSFFGGHFLTTSTTRAATILRIVIVGVGLPYATLLIATGTFSPFLYFQF